MRPQVTTLSGTGTGAWLPVDYRVAPFSLGIQVVTSGTITYTVEYTLDDVLDPTVTATPFAQTNLTAQTTSKVDYLNFPIMAIRIKNTAGTGSTTMTVLQGART